MPPKRVRDCIGMYRASDIGKLRVLLGPDVDFRRMPTEGVM